MKKIWVAHGELDLTGGMSELTRSGKIAITLSSKSLLGRGSTGDVVLTADLSYRTHRLAPIAFPHVLSTSIYNAGTVVVELSPKVAWVREGFDLQALHPIRVRVRVRVNVSVRERVDLHVLQ